MQVCGDQTAWRADEKVNEETERSKSGATAAGEESQSQLS